jgi:signal transduction histidine kinase
MKNKVLVVDDTIANLDILIELLDNYDVIDATNGQEALEIVENEEVDLILLDIIMPNMDGYEVCKKLKSRSRTKDIPIIFITAKTDEDSIEKAYDIGGADYVTKPFKPKELLARVKTQLNLESFKAKEKQQKVILENKISKALEEQKKVSESLISKERLILHQSRLAQMGEMVAMIAHQWRQPLNNISLTVNNLLIQCMINKIDVKTLEEELKLIDSYSQHLSTTIDDFRGFFKENKTQELTTLRQMVDETLSIIKVSLDNQGIKVILDISCTTEFKTYINEVKQVLLNIIKNAEDILLEKDIIDPTIWIKSICKKEDNSPTLVIKDNAGGIPEDIISQIFEPYFSTKKDKDGTGLGLYMSKTIIDDHCGGKISVSNDNQGAVFTLQFNIRDNDAN